MCNDETVQLSPIGGKIGTILLPIKPSCMNILLILLCEIIVQLYFIAMTHIPWSHEHNGSTHGFICMKRDNLRSTNSFGNRKVISLIQFVKIFFRITTCLRSSSYVNELIALIPSPWVPFIHVTALSTPGEGQTGRYLAVSCATQPAPLALTRRRLSPTRRRPRLGTASPRMPASRSW